MGTFGVNPSSPLPKAFSVIWVVSVVISKAPSVLLITKITEVLNHSITEAPYPAVPSLSPYSNQNRAFSTLTMDLMVSSETTESKSTVWFM